MKVDLHRGVLVDLQHNKCCYATILQNFENWFLQPFLKYVLSIECVFLKRKKLKKCSATRILVDMKPIIGYRKPKNLQDIVVSSKKLIGLVVRRNILFQDAIAQHVDTVLELTNQG